MITLPIGETFLEDALRVWGTEAQITCAVEECAEFIVASSHFFRGRENNLEEEIADAIIMLMQMRLLFGKQEIDVIIVNKIERARRRIDAVKEK